MDPIAARPGAVLAEGAVAHFGDPFREQRRLAAGTAFAPLSDRAIIQVHGPDRLTWLDSITSQELSGRTAGESTELLVLDPQGRVEHAAGVFEDGASVWLLADAPSADALAAWLSRMVFRAQVTVQARPELRALGYMAGAEAEASVAPLAIAPAGVSVIWEDPWATVSPGGHQYATETPHPGADFDWRIAVVEASALDALASVEAAGVLAAEALRIAAWRPRRLTEVDERSLPHETDWLRSAVHLHKGCYRGQETVAKVHNLGHPPRRLAFLQLDGTPDTLPAPGDAVFAGDTEVGRVTSAARHYLDGPIALAILSRRAPEGELVVRSGETEIAAGQQVIVPASAGATAEVPRLTRLSRRPSAPDPRAG